MKLSRIGTQRTGRRPAIWILGLALATFAAAGFALRERLLVEWCIQRIKSDDHEHAMAAARRLGDIHGVRAAEGLLFGLAHTARAVRFVAAEELARAHPDCREKALGRQGRATPAAVGALLEILLDAPSAGARAAAAESLAPYACDDERTQITLLGVAENGHEDPNVRLAALESLERTDLPLESLAPVLSDLGSEPDGIGTTASRILRAAGSR